MPDAKLIVTERILCPPLHAVSNGIFRKSTQT